MRAVPFSWKSTSLPTKVIHSEGHLVPQLNSASVATTKSAGYSPAPPTAHDGNVIVAHAGARLQAQLGRQFGLARLHHDASIAKDDGGDDAFAAVESLDQGESLCAS